MAVSITGIVINLIMLVGIIVVIIIALGYQSDLNHCEQRPSPFCYTIHCPCDTGPPCFGYAKKPAGPAGQWYCSNAPQTIVDNQGKAV